MGEDGWIACVLGEFIKSEIVAMDHKSTLYMAELADAGSAVIPPRSRQKGSVAAINCSLVAWSPPSSVFR